MKHKKATGNKQVAKNKEKQVGSWQLKVSTAIAACQLSTANSFLLLSFHLILFSACNSDFVQKERGYFKIDLPKKKYQVFNRPD
ncbi:MAG TPA: hypothetical protein VER36_03165, partial [Flavisolibacter sp.]|nr:hypothetical protein [Flavisolibacter sp.]